MSILAWLTGESNKQAFNPSRFNDPIAKDISWHPIEKGGTNFKTRKLVHVNSYRVEFKKTIKMIAFPWIFILLPFAFYFFSNVDAEPLSKIQSFIDSPFILIFYAAFIGAGVYALITTHKSIVFDKQQGYFRKGKPLKGMRHLRGQEGAIELKRIHAIQLVSEYISSSSSSGNSNYRSYELNLVLENGSRHNVIDHGSYNAIIRDAEELGRFLDVPVWSAL